MTPVMKIGDQVKVRFHDRMLADALGLSDYTGTFAGYQYSYFFGHRLVRVIDSDGHVRKHNERNICV